MSKTKINKKVSNKMVQSRIKNADVKQLESIAMSVSKATLKKPVEDKVKKRQLRCAKKILKDPLIFNI